MHKMIVGPLAVTLLCAGAAPALAQSAGDWGGTWSGFYAGIYGGYALDSVAASSQSVAKGLPGVTAIDLTTSTSRISTLFGGATAGYNAQIGKVVLGVESDVSLGGFSKSSTVTGTITGTDNNNQLSSLSEDSTSSYSLGPMASFRGRLGLEAQPGVLFYLTGGLVVADRTVASTVTYTGTGPQGVPLAAALPSGSSSTQQLVMGPTIGVGVEGMVAEHISLGAEYAYVALPDAPMGGGYVANAAAANFDVSVNSPASFAGGFHSLKAALKYHF